MLSQLVTHTTAPPKDAIKPFGIGFQYCHYTTAAYTYRLKSCLPTQSLSYTTYAMYILCHWITGESVLDDINNRFPLVNDVGISFGILSSVKGIYDKIDWTNLLVDNTKQGSTA